MKKEICGIVVQAFEIEGQTVTVTVSLPAEGYTKAQLLDTFVGEMDSGLRQYPELAPAVLGGILRLNGRMTTEIALAIGAIAARLGARKVELSTPDGSFVPILGDDAPMAMPALMLPGMIVEITRDGGLFRRGGRAVLLNVGQTSVNIAEINSCSRRRDTGWTARKNVQPVGWEVFPDLRR